MSQILLVDGVDGLVDSVFDQWCSSTPQIPPGVVPSASEEKVYNMMWIKAEESSENDVVRDVSPKNIARVKCAFKGTPEKA